MKKIMKLSLVFDEKKTPILIINNNGRRTLIDFEKISSPKYWATIYQRLGFSVKPNHIRLDHDLICLVFGIPANRLSEKLAIRLHNLWRNGKFSVNDIYIDNNDILHVNCPAYSPNKRLARALGYTREQIHYLMTCPEIIESEIEVFI